MSILISYCLIFFGVIIGGCIFSFFRNAKQKFLQSTTIFGGAFLFGICFLQLIPHLYDYSFHIHEHSVRNGSIQSIPLGIFVLLGFIIQLFLENLSKGVEHGHTHSSSNSSFNVVSLVLGLSLHAFLEGMPIVYEGEHVHEALVWGIVIHNIPITLVLTSLLIEANYSSIKRYFFLGFFAIMSPLGSIFHQFFATIFGGYDDIIMALVIGILLHVSVSILFTHDEKGNRLPKMILIILAFVLAYFMPACSH